MGAALDRDRTLGGAVDCVRALALRTDDRHTAGSRPVKSALAPIEPTYGTLDMLV